MIRLAPDQDVLVRMAAPVGADDRRRVRLTSFGLAGAGTFLLAAEEILRLYLRSPFVPAGPSWQGGQEVPIAYQPGLRAGVAFGILVMVVPFVALAVQAMRTGTAARERRYAALSLAGATVGQLRSVAVREGRRAAVRAGLAAGPTYLVAWLLLGRLPAHAYRSLPDPDLVTPLAWLVLVAVLALVGGAAAVLGPGTPHVTPLGISRRLRRPLLPRDAVPPVSALLVIVALTWYVATFGLGETEATGLVLAMLLAYLVLGVTSGPWLVHALGHFAGRGGLISSLAGRRLLADVRTSGRVAGVLFVVGGVLAYLLNSMVETRLLAPMEIGFPVGPVFVTALAIVVGALLATAVACGSLVVGVTEQVLDGRRGIATLVALAASPELVVRVVRRQLFLSAGPPAALGALVVSLSPFVQVRPVSSIPALLVLRLLGALLIGGLTSAVALSATGAVRPAIREAARPENLRAP